jgi:hypothetical protein
MRILLDSRDLINLVEHGQPVPVRDFDAYLRGGRHEIVLCYSNVRELVSPLATGAEFLQIRPFLQSLEQMPHMYIKEVTIVALEIQSAVNAFNAGAEYQVCSPFVDRWDRTLVAIPGKRASAADGLVGLRLDDIVYFINSVNPRLFRPPEHYLSTLRTLLDQDRTLLRKGQVPAREHFILSVGKHAASHGLGLPDGRGDEFAEWVYRNPNRCPGLRLNHEMYRSLMSNYTDAPEAGDFSDLALVFALPYVDAATMDRRMRHYCGVASRKILRFGGAVDYAARVYENVAAFMQSHA